MSDIRHNVEICRICMLLKYIKTLILLIIFVSSVKIYVLGIDDPTSNKANSVPKRWKNAPVLIRPGIGMDDAW